MSDEIVSGKHGKKKEVNPDWRYPINRLFIFEHEGGNGNFPEHYFEPAVFKDSKVFLYSVL